MHLKVVQRILGLLLMMFSISMLPPAVVSLIYDEASARPFLYAFVIVLATGILLWLPVRNARDELRLRDGFLIVAAFWLGLGTVGATPLLFSEVPMMSLTDAVFE